MSKRTLALTTVLIGLLGTVHTAQAEMCIADLKGQVYWVMQLIFTILLVLGLGLLIVGMNRRKHAAPQAASLVVPEPAARPGRALRFAGITVLSLSVLVLLLSLTLQGFSAKSFQHFLQKPPACINGTSWEVSS